MEPQLAEQVEQWLSLQWGGVVPFLVVAPLTHESCWALPEKLGWMMSWAQVPILLDCEIVTQHKLLSGMGCSTSSSMWTAVGTVSQS